MNNRRWAIGVLAAGAENVQRLSAGEETTEQAAIEAASDAAVLAAMDRGREEYRITVAGTEMMLTPGLTDDGEVDLWGVHDAVFTITDRP